MDGRRTALPDSVCQFGQVQDGQTIPTDLIVFFASLTVPSLAFDELWTDAKTLILYLKNHQRVYDDTPYFKKLEKVAALLKRLDELKVTEIAEEFGDVVERKGVPCREAHLIFLRRLHRGGCELAVASVGAVLDAGEKLQELAAVGHQQAFVIFTLTLIAAIQARGTDLVELCVQKFNQGRRLQNRLPVANVAPGVAELLDKLPTELWYVVSEEGLELREVHRKVPEVAPTQEPVYVLLCTTASHKRPTALGLSLPGRREKKARLESATPVQEGKAVHSLLERMQYRGPAAEATPDWQSVLSPTPADKSNVTSRHITPFAALSSVSVIRCRVIDLRSCQKREYEALMRRHLTCFFPVTVSLFDMHVDDVKTRSAFARVQFHVEELRRFFDLPEDELFLDEFYCALSKRILLQGRMYIFERHLCFYSNVFGWVKRKVIPLHTVKSVTKRRNYGFPNSIEVVWEKKEFFTSFLNRNDAYELLCDAVRHLEPPSPNENEELRREPTPTSSTGSIASRRRHAKRVSKGSDQAEEDSDLDGNDEEIDVWSVISGDAPVVSENMSLLCEDQYGVSVREFFARTLTIESMFLDEYHKRRGDTRYRISEWEQLNEISGFVRQATFVSPVKGVRGIGFMSPKATECNQDHRLRVFRGDHLVFQISQVMKDIPYGDNFRVEMRWDVTPIPDTTACHIAIHVAVPFIRSVLGPFRSLIESNVMKEMQESVQIMTEMLKKTLNSPDPVEPDLPLADPTEHEETREGRADQVLAKLQNLLSTEEGLQKLEQIVESTERNSASVELKPYLSPLPSAALPVGSAMLLLMLWTCPRAHSLDKNPLDLPLRQLYDVQSSIISAIDVLNATLMERHCPSLHEFTL